MAYGQGADPRNATVKTGDTFSGPGLVLTNDSTNNTMKIHPGGAVVPLGVTVGDSTRTEAGVLQTAAGATVSYYPLGGVLMIQSAASQTFTTGLAVYAGASGLLLDSSDSSDKQIGIYVGEGDASTSAGDMIAVMTSGVGVA